MRVQRMLMPDGSESWTVLDASGGPVPAVEGFLAHLQALDRSPNTIRTYATSLKLWSQFLDRLGVGVDEVAVEHVSRFVAWLRAPADNVTVLAGGSGRCGPGTVNKHPAALFSFYDYQARNGVVLAQSLVAWRRANRGEYRPFLHHVTGGRPVATRPLRVRQSRRLPRTLTEEQLLTLVEACDHLRDRFLRILPRRDNANGARAKTFEEHTIPISVGLVRLYTGYMFDEYGQCDSDYVFVNLFAQPYGRPLRYQAVHQLVRRLRARTGIEFTLHMLRHSRATELLRAGVGVDVVARLLTHRSSTTTSQTYAHLDVEDLRAELTRHGAWDRKDPR